MHVVAPREASTRRSKVPKGEWVERTCDYVIASGSLKGCMLQMEVVEDFESRPHQEVSFLVERGKKIQDRNGMSRSCRRSWQVTVEEGCQKGTQQKTAEKKER